MSEINVVPYIDVMLVLLVIFMVTAPLLTQGVKVTLPQAEAEVIAAEDESAVPIVITVDRVGNLYLDVGDDLRDPLERDLLLDEVRGLLDDNPDRPVLIKGDAAVEYGAVVAAMVIAQTAGAPSVGLITVPPDPVTR